MRKKNSNVTLTLGSVSNSEKAESWAGKPFQLGFDRIPDSAENLFGTWCKLIRRINWIFELIRRINRPIQ